MPFVVGVDLDVLGAAEVFRRQLRLDLGRDDRVLDEGRRIGAVGVPIRANAATGASAVPITKHVVAIACFIVSSLSLVRLAARNCGAWHSASLSAPPRDGLFARVQSARSWRCIAQMRGTILYSLQSGDSADRRSRGRRRTCDWARRGIRNGSCASARCSVSAPRCAWRPSRSSRCPTRSRGTRASSAAWDLGALAYLGLRLDADREVRRQDDARSRAEPGPERLRDLPVRGRRLVRLHRRDRLRRRRDPRTALLEPRRASRDDGRGAGVVVAPDPDRVRVPLRAPLLRRAARRDLRRRAAAFPGGREPDYARFRVLLVRGRDDVAGIGRRRSPRRRCDG